MKIPGERFIREAELRAKLQINENVNEVKLNAEIAKANADFRIAELRVSAFQASFEQGKVNRQQIADGRIASGSSHKGKFVTGADGRQRWAEEARVKRLGFVEIEGRHANSVLESHPQAKAGDVISAFEAIEAQGRHRVTINGKILANSVVDVVKNAKKLLPRIVLHREHGTPEQLCGKWRRTSRQ